MQEVKSTCLECRKFDFETNEGSKVMGMKLTKEFVNSCRKVSVLRDFLCQAIDQIDAMEEERRWRKFSEEKPKYKQWILVFVENPSNYGTYIELRRWDITCKFDVENQELYTKWMPLPAAPKEADK